MSQDLITSQILSETKIILFDNLFNTINTAYSDKNGYYSFAVDCAKTYNVRASKENYNTKEQKVFIKKENGKTNLDIALEKAVCKVSVGDDLGKCFVEKLDNKFTDEIKESVISTARQIKIEDSKKDTQK
jgi:WD40 repeat protein